MNTIKHICLTIIQLFKQIFALPADVSSAVKARQRRMELKELEIERLDRIRNPLKYRGK
jgi:hypothetical protein